MLPLRDNVNLAAMAKKGYLTFPIAPALKEPHHQIIQCYIQDARFEWVSYPSAEKQSVYSTASADWAKTYLKKLLLIAQNNNLKLIM